MKLSLPLSFLLLSFMLIQCDQKTDPNANSSTESLNSTWSMQDGWVRPAKAGRMSAAYFNLQNPSQTADTLIAAASDVTANTQIHLSFKNEEGLMAMEEQKMVPVEPGETVSFKQGGLHIMLIQPEKDLNPSDSVRITLYLLSGDSIATTLPVESRMNNME